MSTSAGLLKLGWSYKMTSWINNRVRRPVMEYFDKFDLTSVYQDEVNDQMHKIWGWVEL